MTDARSATRISPSPGSCGQFGPLDGWSRLAPLWGLQGGIGGVWCGVGRVAPHFGGGYCRDFGEGVKEGLGRKPFPPGVLCWWLFSPPLFMVVEVFQGTELKLRAWMTSWYEVLV